LSLPELVEELGRRLREADERLFQAKVEELFVGKDYL
jgi:hypothetical protein